MGSFAGSFFGSNGDGGQFPGQPSLQEDYQATLATMNAVRMRFGLPAMPSMPTAVMGNTAECLYARGLGDIASVSVGGDASIRFEDTERGRLVAQALARLTGQSAVGATVQAPAAFKRVIQAFDHGKLGPEFSDPNF